MNKWRICFKTSTNIAVKEVCADRVKYESGIVMFFTVQDSVSTLVYLCNTDQINEIELIS